MPSGVRQFWDQVHPSSLNQETINNCATKYRIYVGLLVTPPVFRKPLPNTNNNKRNRDEAADDSPDENAADVDIQVGAAPTATDPNQVPRKRYRRPGPSYREPGIAMDDDNDDDDDDAEEDEATIERKKADAEEFREERLIAFLNDPERSMKIFLSSYMREQGLIW